MKHSKKTLLTALMFSAAAVGAGAVLLRQHLSKAYCVYGPPPVSEADASDTGSVLSSMTKDDFLNITDDELIALAEQYSSLPRPEYCSFLPDSVPLVNIELAEKSAKNTAEAFALVSERSGGLPALEREKKSGQWWLYAAGSGIIHYYLVLDSDFFDVETQTLNAKVNEENVLKLAAMQDYRFGHKLAAFTEDEGSRIRCTEFTLHYSSGEEGQCDTAVINGREFTVDKKTGKLEGFQDEAYMFHQEAELPGTGQAETE
ncbi:MAG: hypothetical protein IJL32_11970 [Oscillospiraceae bacterium]|nr:hypothetical protein [Oscillospiraceae bacterium]